MSDIINVDELEERALDNDLDSIKALINYFESKNDSAHAEYWKKRYESLGGVVPKQQKEKKQSQMDIWRQEYNSKQTESLLLADLKKQINDQNPYALFVYADKYLQNNDEKLDAWERGVHLIEGSSSSKDELYQLHVKLAGRCRSLKKNNSDAYAVKMLRHYENAYELKGDKTDADVLKKLAECYNQGIGTAPNPNKAVELQMKTVRKGKSKDKFELAVSMQKNGNRMEAIELLESCVQNAKGEGQEVIRDFSLLKLKVMNVPLSKALDKDAAKAAARVLESYSLSSASFTAEERSYILDNMNSIIDAYNADKNAKAIKYVANMSETDSKNKERALRILAYNYNDKDALLSLINIYKSTNNYSKLLPCMEQYSKTWDNRFDEEIANRYKNGFGVVQDLDKAAKYYLSSKKGKAETKNALWEIAQMYRNAGRQDEEAKYYLEVAQEGDYYGYTVLGDKCLKNGEIEKALEYYEKAARKGEGFANLALCNLYEEGKGVEKNSEKALEYCIKAVEKNVPKACSKIGMMYLNGDTMPKDTDKAIALLTVAADREDEIAAYQLGKLYFEGKLVEKNKTLAEKYYAIAGMKGNSDAAYQAGMLYLEEPTNRTRKLLAQKNLEIAAKQGDERADYPLAELYLESNTGVNALPYLERYLNNHPDDVKALTKAGMLYQATGSFDQERSLKAVDYLKRAGNNPEACFYLGQIYEYGRPGVNKDISKAISLYKIAEKGGISTATTKIGYLKERGGQTSSKQEEKKDDKLKVIVSVVLALIILSYVGPIVGAIILGVFKHPILMIVLIAGGIYIVNSLSKNKNK